MGDIFGIPIWIIVGAVYKNQNWFLKGGNIFYLHVVLPAYNAKQVRQETVASVLDQPYKGINIVRVDGGSTDGSTFLCDQIAQKEELVTVIHQKTRTFLLYAMWNTKQMVIVPECGRNMSQSQGICFLEKGVYAASRV